ncbi:hypothetical protein [Thermoactinomyces mirandus]|uniref:Uncharacterized protein n=1 Tax=Thermoactinomyces mirandus TaxID=2756294 RepID=A0A7W1XTC0_9BACL|nr:hypothetical protein [Thermoactinomyces mirandus]MBA4602907.1 hypothetical protein [Thermoactinomyces mirandus]
MTIRNLPVKSKNAREKGKRSLEGKTGETVGEKVCLPESERRNVSVCFQAR